MKNIHNYELVVLGKFNGGNIGRDLGKNINLYIRIGIIVVIQYPKYNAKSA